MDEYFARDTTELSFPRKTTQLFRSDSTTIHLYSFFPRILRYRSNRNFLGNWNTVSKAINEKFTRAKNESISTGTVIRVLLSLFTLRDRSVKAVVGISNWISRNSIGQSIIVSRQSLGKVRSNGVEIEARRRGDWLTTTPYVYFQTRLKIVFTRISKRNKYASILVWNGAKRKAYERLENQGCWRRSWNHKIIRSFSNSRY